MQFWKTQFKKNEGNFLGNKTFFVDIDIELPLKRRKMATLIF